MGRNKKPFPIFENITITDKKDAFNPALIENCIVKNVVINGVKKD
jgi:hypothetical protein